MPTYNELVIVARGEDVRDRGAMIRSFLQRAGAGPRGGAPRPDVGRRRAASPPTRTSSAARPLASVKATIPAFFPADASKPFGYMDPRVGDATALDAGQQAAQAACVAAGR